MKFASLEDRYAESKTEIAELRRDIDTLRLASEGYRKIRNRFLETYRRDVVIHNLDPKSRQNIAGGNEAAHHGDAIADAALYTSRERSDHALMSKIYGVSVYEITCLGKC
jgi:hypothetical protein